MLPITPTREAHLPAFGRAAAEAAPEGVAESASAEATAGVTPAPPDRPGWREPSWADRLLEWRDDPRVVAAGAVVLALVAGLLFYRSALGAGGGDAVTTPTGAGVVPSSTAVTTAEVVVHVSGAVVSPGVYTLAGTARVADAVEAAGGATPEGEVHRLNLAARLGDGQRVHVPVPGEPLPEGAGPAGEVGGVVNVNLATPEQLESLPGVGPTLAAAIVTERDRRGGFRSVDDLLGVRGIGEKRLADLRPLVTV